MPTYEYKCFSCNKEFEVVQKITEEPLKTCPSCQSSNFKRLISSTSFLLKGTGWYKTDYASNNGNNGSSRSHSKHTKSSSSEGAGSVSETKSEKKEESASSSSTKSEANSTAGA